MVDMILNILNDLTSISFEIALDYNKNIKFYTSTLYIDAFNKI